jgi:hypothetical protein
MAASASVTSRSIAALLSSRYALYEPHLIDTPAIRIDYHPQANLGWGKQAGSGSRGINRLAMILTITTTSATSIRKAVDLHGSVPRQICLILLKLRTTMGCRSTLIWSSTIIAGEMQRSRIPSIPRCVGPNFDLRADNSTVIGPCVEQPQHMEWRMGPNPVDRHPSLFGRLVGKQ